MLALLSIPSLLMFFFSRLYSVQKYFAINMELFSKGSLSTSSSFSFSYSSFIFECGKCCQLLSLV